MNLLKLNEMIVKNMWTGLLINSIIVTESTTPYDLADIASTKANKSDTQEMHEKAANAHLEAEKYHRNQIPGLLERHSNTTGENADDIADDIHSRLTDANIHASEAKYHKNLAK